ncbi:MAG: YerC/YecD family TrpR-related protein [Candidatus Veblenbacteria bacterium]|nr:YerC/YecD family TrpR-related protein [Candidatus Veblenbacteria bacterium]MDZ4229557.1 YerC/YecD family TrpR-related protein [Candidatus Veblenbacteria bacterium]
MKQGKKWDSQEANELYAAILKLKTTVECRRFFRDLCTPEELVDMADRFQAAKLLIRDIDYRDIAGRLKVSTTTVARVAQWLWGGMGGYQLVLQRLGLTK